MSTTKSAVSQCWYSGGNSLTLLSTRCLRGGDAIASRGGGCGLGGCGFGGCGLTNGDDVRFKFRLAGLSGAGPGRDCPRSAGDGLNSGVVGADSRRAFLATIEGDVVADDTGSLGEPAGGCLGEDEVAAFTEEALASPGTRGLAFFGIGCADVVADEEEGVGLRGWM